MHTTARIWLRLDAGQLIPRTRKNQETFKDMRRGGEERSQQRRKVLKHRGKRGVEEGGGVGV